MRSSQSSFTLLETLIAIGLLVTMILEISSAQGNAITITNYDRKLSQGIWLAKAVMSEVEYKWNYYDLKEIKTELGGENPLPEEICPRDPNFDCDFRYKLEVEEWKLPLVEVALGAAGGKKGGDGDGESAEPDPMTSMIKEQVKNILGDELLKIAYVEISWPEGSKRNSVDLSYLLTAQKKLDEQIELLKPIADPNAKPGQPQAGQGGLPAGATVPPGGAPGGPPGAPPGAPPGGDDPSE